MLFAPRDEKVYLSTIQKTEQKHIEVCWKNILIHLSQGKAEVHKPRYKFIRERGGEIGSIKKEKKRWYDCERTKSDWGRNSTTHCPWIGLTYHFITFVRTNFLK